MNDDIRRTLEKEPNLFWYFNNGITLISNTVKKSMAGGADRSLGTFRCESVSVVNGAQTVSTIGKYGNTEAAGFDNVSVQLRVISLESADGSFGGSITKTNNRQNRIDNRDFVSLDPEQARIRNELAIDGVQYHLLRSEVVSRSETACDLIESTTGLACASGDSGLAVQLKREIGKLWEDLGKPPYRALFNPSVTGMQVWRCVRVQRGIDAQIDMIANKLADAGGRPYSIAIHGNRIIALLVFTSIPKAQMGDPGADFEPFVSAAFLAPKVARACETLNAAVEAEYAGSIIPTLFKNATKCKKLFESCTKSLADAAE